MIDDDFTWGNDSGNYVQSRCEIKTVKKNNAAHLKRILLHAIMQTPFSPHFDRQNIFRCPNQTSPRLSPKGSPTFCINSNFFPSRFFQDDEAGEGSDRPKPDVGRQVREKQNILFYFMCETAVTTRIANSNNTNATDIHDVYLSANAGDPYLDHFEPTEAEKAVS